MMADMARRNRAYRVRKAPFIVLIFFIIMGLAGIASGEPARVLAQAVRICLSCIGIG